MRTCTHSGCNRPHYGKGYCQRHYARFRRTGNASAVRKLANGTTRRWLSDVAMQWESDDCLLYPFAIGNHGYGLTQGDLAHRHVCEMAHGRPPFEGAQAAHSCGTAACVNKRHLRWATRLENASDKLLHGTLLSGERHPHAKLTAEQVEKIKSSTAPQRVTAAQFGIAQQHVSDIKNGRRW